MSPLLQPPRKILYLGIDPPDGVVHYPVIRTERLDSPDLERAIQLSDRCTHFIFTSKHAVRYWPGSIEGRSAIAIGEATAREIKIRGGYPLLAPDATQEGVMALLNSLDLQDAYLLYPRSKRARMDLTGYLKDKNIAHFTFDLYDTVLQKLEPVPDLSQFDEIVFTSPSVVEGFCRIFPSVPDRIALTPIGPITKRALVDLFFRMYDRVQILSEETKTMIAAQEKPNYQIPDLPYDFNALEPVISGKIMELHYSKHHKGYVTNLNAALEKYHEAETKNDVAAMIALQSAIKFNGGGHINHTIFWTILAPIGKGGGGQPHGELAKMIDRDFNSFDTFKEKFSALTTSIQGSGWGWLGYNKSQKKLEITTCANQDPLSTHGLVPILGIDVWEHAYYLQYMNVRPDYVKAIWQVFNWRNIEERFAKACM